jgi:hypothetical protein
VHSRLPIQPLNPLYNLPFNRVVYPLLNQREDHHQRQVRSRQANQVNNQLVFRRRNRLLLQRVNQLFSLSVDRVHLHLVAQVVNQSLCRLGILVATQLHNLVLNRVVLRLFNPLEDHYRAQVRCPQVNQVYNQLDSQLPLQVPNRADYPLVSPAINRLVYQLFFPRCNLPEPLRQFPVVNRVDCRLVNRVKCQPVHQHAFPQINQLFDQQEPRPEYQVLFLLVNQLVFRLVHQLIHPLVDQRQCHLDNLQVVPHVNRLPSRRITQLVFPH